MAKLEAVNLKQQYLYGTTGVDDLTFSVENASFVVLGGEESGKTSLLRVLAGKEPPFSGSVLYDGIPIEAIPVSERNIVYVRAQDGVFRFRSARYNLAYPLKIRKFPKDEIARRVDSALRRSGFSGREDVRAGTLSPLNLARLKLARCFVREADYRLIDYVQNGLCRDDRRAIFETLLEINALPGVKIFTTDRFEEAACLADAGAVLYYGITEQTGAVAEFYRNPFTPEVFRLTHGTPSIEEGSLDAAAGEIRCGAKKITLDPTKLKPETALPNSESRDGLIPVLVATAPDGVTKIYSAHAEKLIYFD